MRIHITGNAGAGKTTLARKLGARLDLPVTHLDQIVWAPGWRKVPHLEREQALSRITAPESWIVEGVSRFVRERADLVVFLDVSRPVCLWRCLARNVRYLFKSRPELPDNCPEWRIWPRLLGIVWRFPELVGKHVRLEASESPRYVVLHGGTNINEWVKGFGLAGWQVAATRGMNGERIRFEVFGRRIDVERTEDGWIAFVPGNDGKRRRSEIAIPSDLKAEEFSQYLGDLFHEAATPRHPDVRVL